jgi:hypothetical protein
MSTHDQFDRFLAQRLRESQPSIQDDGFTNQMMAQLPARQRRHWVKEWLILWLPCLAISSIVIANLPLGSSTSDLWAWIIHDPVSLISFGAVGFILALLACAGWLAREMKLT